MLFYGGWYLVTKVLTTFNFILACCVYNINSSKLYLSQISIFISQQYMHKTVFTTLT